MGSEMCIRDRMQRVVLRGTCSSWSPVLSGVPQGTIFGPVLFTLYVNDISSGISSAVKLYADDTKVYREIFDIARETSILQSDLFHLRNCSEVWQLNFNAKKCEIMRVTHNRDKSVPHYYLVPRGERLSSVRTSASQSRMTSRGLYTLLRLSIRPIKFLV